ncbi:MAG: hypothetical protein IJK18_02170 [Clostridia bacterium]|nr:hypothetical protein [Clostridia bacterium]
MKKTIGNLIIIIYAVVAIFTTICLLTFNEYKVSEFGDKTLVIINKDEEGTKYKKGDLVIVGKEGYEKADKGDTIFFYDNDGIKIAEVEQKNDFGDAGITFTIEGNYQVVKSDMIGASNNEKVISKVGSILSVLESKWGFLFLIVFPSLLAFLHEIYEFILELTNKK